MHSAAQEWKRRLGCIGMVLAFILVVEVSPAQTNRTWTGAVNSDWFNAGNWSPTGVPGTNDMVNITNGTVNFSAPVTINNQLNWTAGTLEGTSLTITVNGVMNISPPSTIFLECPLTNAGTVTWSNTGALGVLNNNGTDLGEVVNLSGATWNIQNDQNLFNNVIGQSFFHNAGTLQKSSTTSTTTFGLILDNTGVVTASEGTLNFTGGGAISGTFSAAGGATISFSQGSYTNSTPVTINGPGAAQFTGSASLFLLSNAIPNLPLLQGTVNLGPAFEGGTITNLTLAGASLSGTNTVTGVLNLNNGTIDGPLTIASNGLLNINGTTTMFMDGPVTNAGTVIWTNTGALGVLNGGTNVGQIVNLAGAVWDIQSDENLFNNSTGEAFFHNAGTLEKTSHTGNTTFGLLLDNSGSVDVLEGTLDFTGGGAISGTFNSSAGAIINFFQGSYTNSGPVTLNGPGTIQFNGSGSLLLLSAPIPNLALQQGTVNLGPAFEGGTITNLTLAGASLSGANTVTGVLNLNNGTIEGPLTIATNGLLNINGTTTMFMDGPVTNAGTVIWTNTGSLGVLNGGTNVGQIVNLAGAIWNIQNDQNLFNNDGGQAFFHNAGTLEKTSHTGNTTFNLLLDNSGSVDVLEGTLDFTGGGAISGTYNSSAGAIINFFQGSFTNSGPVTLNGPGTIEFDGSGSLLLLSNAIPNLSLLQGTVNLGPTFEGGTVTNLTLAGASLAGTNTVTGVLNLNNGTILGPLTIATNGLLNINGTTTMDLNGPVTNAGTVIWTNTGSLGVLNGSGNLGLVMNLAGATWNIQNDQNLFNNNSGPAYFYNAGTLQKSSHTGTSTFQLPVTNSGTITALEGNISFQDGLTPVGGTLNFGMSSAANYGSMSITGSAALGGSAGVLWLNGFVPAFGNSFTVMTYGSFTGSFTNLILPPAAIWEVTYNPMSFVLAIGSINKVAFTTQPMGPKLTNQILAPVVVQVEDPSGNPIATNGVPITISLNGSGTLSGALLTQNTDATGKVTFSNLNVNSVGTKTLAAASPGLTGSVSAMFQIVSLIGEQWSKNGMLLTLNGTNNLGPVIIYASTNLINWVPIYTNVPTNGPIQYLDTSATNYRMRFYGFSN